MSIRDKIQGGHNSVPPPIKKDGMFNWNFDKLDNVVRAATFNSPLVKMGLLGALGYFGGRKLAPTITRVISPHIPGVMKDSQGNPINTADSWSTMNEKDQNDLRNTMGWGLAGLLAAPTLLNNLNFKEPLWGLGQFSSKHLEKNNSAWAIPPDPFAEAPTLPVNYARDVIMSSPDLKTEVKATALGVLDAFPANAQVTSSSIIDKAIETGWDAVKGGAVGFVTAKALGLPNPLVTAGIFGGLKAIF